MFRFGIIMNPIDSINPQWDSTFALMLALQKKGLVEYIEPHSLYLKDKKIFAYSSVIKVSRNKRKYFMQWKSPIEKTVRKREEIEEQKANSTRNS